MSSTSRKNKLKKISNSAALAVQHFKCRWFEDYCPYPQVIATLFPPEDQKIIIKKLAELEDSETYPYADNIRVCLKGDPEGEILYAQALKKGCCGFEDLELKSKDGKRIYKIGCNFGH